MASLESSLETERSEANATEQPLPGLRSTLIESAEVLHETGILADELLESFKALPEDAPILTERSQILAQAFDLDAYELKVIFACLARELLPLSATLFTNDHDPAHRDQVCFRFCQAVFADANSAATAPTAPLRLWHLLELERHHTLADSSLRLDERILHFLIGIDTFDARLAPYFEAIEFESAPAESALTHSQAIVQAWQQAANFKRFPLCQLVAAESEPCLDVVNGLCQLTGLQAYTLKHVSLPDEAYEREALAKLWQREALLSKRILYVDAIHHLSAQSQDRRWLESIRGPILIGTRNPESNPLRRSAIAIELLPPDSQSRFECVQRQWDQFGVEADEATQATCQSFQLGEAAIGRAANRALSQSRQNDVPLHHLFRNACKEESRHNLGQLTQRIEITRNWSHLVLPEKQMELLGQIARQARNRPQVYQQWGFGTHNPNGLGITALLSGPSGTGKTLAAEVIANDLDLDLFRIDLSAVVSKYIGETEENLRRVFDAADTGGAVLLFDEADSLFGNRSEVKDSHDRHANIEVSYLLQRMETYRGIALLTTNLKKAIDPAFLRRLRFIVDFPYPDAALRLRLWQGAFPPDAPLEDLNYDALSRLSLSGGNIRNIVLNAAFQAADSSKPIHMRHLQQAVRYELSKLERAIPESEIKALLQ